MPAISPSTAASPRRWRRLLKPDDLIWIHDYHLIPLAAELRRRGVTNRIGYFHHIPWPPAEVFGALPFSATLISTMSAYDLIGVQTQVDAAQPDATGSRALCGASVEGDRVCDGAAPDAGPGLPDRHRCRGFPRLAAASVRAATMPDQDDQAVARRAQAGDRRRQARLFQGHRPAAGGLRARSCAAIPSIAAGSACCRSRRPRAPTCRNMPNSTASPTRSPGRLNAALGEFDWTPIRVVKKAYSRNALAGFYRRAQVGLVTPMRDGMNLVAKEYIAAQDPDDPGVLVLSRFAGAAQQMGEALIVNPYDTHEVAEAIRTALAMPRSERIRRFEQALRHHRRHRHRLVDEPLSRRRWPAPTLGRRESPRPRAPRRSRAATRPSRWPAGAGWPARPRRASRARLASRRRFCV